MSGYVYRGPKRDGLPDLVTLNAGIMAARPPGTPGPAEFEWGTAVRYPRHGTPAGYRSHLRHGEPACDSCRAAERDRARDRGSGLTVAEAQRQRRAREVQARITAGAA